MTNSTAPLAPGAIPEKTRKEKIAELELQGEEIRKKSHRLAQRAWALTGFWIACVVVYAIVTTCGHETEALQLNEFGDFFSGVSAPLAFLWLVVGYYQQGWELRQNTIALNAQLLELRESVEHQAELSSSTKRQTDLLAEDLADRRYKQVLNAQPTFSVGGRSSGKTNEGVIRTMIAITHTGPLVTGVTVEFSGPLVRQSFGKSKITRWQAHQNIDREITWDPFASEDFTSNMRIAYTDANGDQQHQDFQLFRVANNSAIEFDADGNSYSSKSAVDAAKPST